MIDPERKLTDLQGLSLKASQKCIDFYGEHEICCCFPEIAEILRKQKLLKRVPATDYKDSD